MIKCKFKGLKWKVVKLRLHSGGVQIFCLTLPAPLYMLAYNPHNVRDTFIYYKRPMVTENLNILY